MNLGLFTSRKATRFRLALEKYQDFNDSVKLIYTDDPETYEIMSKEGRECILHDWRNLKGGVVKKNVIWNFQSICFNYWRKGK